jgi:hypothetical protein
VSFPFVALALLLPFALSGCALPEQEVADVVWRKGNEFIRIEHQDDLNGGPPPPNAHPVRIPGERIRGALQLVAVRQTPNARPRPLFMERSLDRLGKHIEAGLAKAQPNQDVTFALEQWYPGLLGLKDPKVITGRVFYAGGWLNLVFGSVLHEGAREKAEKGYDMRRSPYTPGMRSASMKREYILWAPPGSGVFTAPAAGRADWLVFSPQALAPRGPGAGWGASISTSERP